MTNAGRIFAFIDMLFNLLLGITCFFIISYLMINPTGDQGKIDPPVKMMVTMEWPDDSSVDIDLWVRGYDKVWVGFENDDGSYLVLERDDRGSVNDIITINGKQETIQRNYEVINFSTLPAGEYFVNIHYFSGLQNEKEAVPVTVTLTKITPYKMLFTETVDLGFKQEETVVSFVVNQEGKVEDIRTDIDMPHMKKRNNGTFYQPGFGDIDD